MMNGIFAIVNVQTGKLWRGKTFNSYNAADMALESFDLQLPKLAELFDIFELSPTGWEIADNYQRDADVCRILGTNYGRECLAIA